MVKVSVLMPIKGPALWLSECLTSLEQQTFDDWNLIVVIHGHCENAQQLLDACVFPVVLMNAPDSFSLAEVLNLGLGRCDGEYVARFDCDDITFPNRLSLQANYLDANPDVALVGSAALEINESGELVGYRSVPGNPVDVYKRLRWRNAIIHPSAMFRRTAVVELGGYNKYCAYAEDYELWLRLQKTWNIASLEIPLIEYRVHRHQLSRTYRLDSATMCLAKSARVSLAYSNSESTLVAKARFFLWATWLRIRKFS